MLTPGEKLFLARRRANLNQTEFASFHFKVSANTYRNYESGRQPVPERWKVPEIKNLTDIERYVILRRRNFVGRQHMKKTIRATPRPDLPPETQEFLRKLPYNRVLHEETGLEQVVALKAWWGDQPV